MDCPLADGEGARGGSDAQENRTESTSGADQPAFPLQHARLHPVDVREGKERERGQHGQRACETLQNQHFYCLLLVVSVKKQPAWSFLQFAFDIRKPIMLLY